MKRVFAESRVHGCIDKANARLLEYNTRLSSNLMNPNTIFVETERVTPRRGSRAKRVIATFCPFCGEKIDDSC